MGVVRCAKNLDRKIARQASGSSFTSKQTKRVERTSQIETEESLAKEDDKSNRTKKPPSIFLVVFTLIPLFDTIVCKAIVIVDDLTRTIYDNRPSLFS